MQGLEQEGDWPIPILDRAGQKAFWDRQAPIYDTADMTLDNMGELEIVETLAQDFISNRQGLCDVVTLGGAVGSRDPKIVLDVMSRMNTTPSCVYFNDLSSDMASRAVNQTLESYSGRFKVTALAGPIHEIGDAIPTLPRRVILGAYRAKALTEAYPDFGYPLSGIAEYLKNAQIIGTRLCFQPVMISDGVYAEPEKNLYLNAESSAPEIIQVSSEINQYIDIKRIDAIRIIGTHEDKLGYFISHWYTKKGIIQLLRKSFGLNRRKRMSVMSCAKGYVVCIDPTTEPSGIITMLNNVIGNIIPDEQVQTLKFIEKISN